MTPNPDPVTAGSALVAAPIDAKREAALLKALAAQGLTGGKAKAAARLLDNVEFDENGEPTNVAAALKAAKQTYGDGLPTQSSDAPAAATTGWFRN
jgi:hypothetical protein